MFYKYDKENLLWKKDWKKTKFALSTVLVLLIASFSLGRLIRIQALDKYERELLVLSLENEKNKFTKQKFADELKRLNVKFPHIVMAQSIIETGNFK